MNFNSNKIINWDDLIFPKPNIDNEIMDSCIEYIDCEEVANTLISMDKKSLTEKYEPYIRNFTHCEIHPGLIFSIIASIIPFPDHNQSPEIHIKVLCVNRQWAFVVQIIRIEWIH